MNFRRIWKTDLLKPNERYSVQALCFKTDYSQLIAACSNILYFIQPQTGEIIEKKKSHLADINTVKCSHDGVFFASGSTDGNVVIWRSVNNEGIVTHGNASSATHLVWSPTKQILVSAARKEFSIWKPDENNMRRNQAIGVIQTIAFSVSGETLAMSLDNGSVVILDSESLDIVQTYSYSSIVSTLKFVTVKEIEYLVTADLSCRVSMYRTSDKALVGKNSIPFEALTCECVGDNSFFFVFAGVSGKVSLLTSSLSYLGDFNSSSEWIWDMCVDKQGRIAVATKEGCVEFCSIDYSLAFASAGDTLIYRNSVNEITVRNILSGDSKVLTFNKIIVDTTMSSEYFLVQFKDSIKLYEHSTADGELVIGHIQEISGLYENSMFAILKYHILHADGNTITFYDTTGHKCCNFKFSSQILSVENASAYNDGAVVAFQDGNVYFVNIDMRDPVLLAKHSRKVISAKKSGLLTAFLDDTNILRVVDSFERRDIATYTNVVSFAWSNRIDGLLVTSNGMEISIHYEGMPSITEFIEGNILGFVRNQVLLSKDGAIEATDVPLPLKELIAEDKWELVRKLTELGLNHQQLTCITVEAIKKKQFDLAKFIAPDVSNSLAFFVYEILNETKNEDIDQTIASFIDGEPTKKKHTFENVELGKAVELEKSGQIEEALALYAEVGKWDDVFRLAQEKHMERSIVDYEFPEDQSERAAKVILAAGLSEGAIRLLTKSQNVVSLAKAHIYLGQWIEAISLSRLYPQVYNIVYPRFGQLLFEGGKFFESLVCFFIPKDREERSQYLAALIKCSADSHHVLRLSFLHLMVAFNEPEIYWDMLQRCICYLAANRLKNYTMLPMSFDDSVMIFYLSYYVCASLNEFPLLGVDIPDILIQLVVSSSALGMKFWVAYGLKELNNYNLNEKLKQLAQRATRLANDTDKEPLEMRCPRCDTDILKTTKIPRLCCPECGLRLVFSSYSCRPLPLSRFSYVGDDYEDLIRSEPSSFSKGVDHSQEQLQETVTKEFLKKYPSEYFVIRSLKPKAGVKPDLLYNKNLENIHVCSCCGSLFDDLDWECSTLEFEYCPICYTTIIDVDNKGEVHSEILEMLRPFQPDSPVTF